jgi:hypothetical protein
MLERVKVHRKRGIARRWCDALAHDDLDGQHSMNFRRKAVRPATEKSRFY